MKLNQRLIAIILIEIICIVGIGRMMWIEAKEYQDIMRDLELANQEIIFRERLVGRNAASEKSERRMLGSDMVRSVRVHVKRLMTLEVVLIVCLCAVIVTGLRCVGSSRQL